MNPSRTDQGMPSYVCSCGNPADWYIQLKNTRMWHGREAIEERDLGDLAYACCDTHLPEAIKFTTQGVASTLRVRPVNRG